ncbi:hypothetical protein FACS1894156_5000 [Bacteroidia bacterium]|nr:hypothetical protein FACS1894156_5000 [Bacteroidia bacterium]
MENTSPNNDFEVSFGTDDHALTQITKTKLIDLVSQSTKNFASSGLSSNRELGEAKQPIPATKGCETTSSPVSGYKDKRLFSIFQILHE